MPKLIVQASNEGYARLTRELEEAGIEPGALVELQWSALPGPKEIQRRASKHTVWKLGDAIRVTWPQWIGNEWRVDLLSMDGQEQIGQLFYTPQGELEETRSTDATTLR